MILKIVFFFFGNDLDMLFYPPFKCLNQETSRKCRQLKDDNRCVRREILLQSIVWHWLLFHLWMHFLLFIGNILGWFVLLGLLFQDCLVVNKKRSILKPLFCGCPKSSFSFSTSMWNHWVRLSAGLGFSTISTLDQEEAGNTPLIQLISFKSILGWLTKVTKVLP